jgi:3-oxoacyl-[acyl-carrier protein] reductase
MEEGAAVAQDEGRRVAFVTGAAVGIGQAIAIRLAAEGFAVALGYHARSAEDAVAAIEAAGGEAMAIDVDVMDSERVETAVAQVVSRLGRLDVVVNNAGGLVGRVPIGEMTDEHWNHVLALNLTSAFYGTRAAGRHLGPGGRIVNVSSNAAQSGGGPGAAAYAAAKAGVIGFTRAAAKELGSRGITVNALAPGFIEDTPFHATFSTPEAQRSMAGQAALGRAGKPADVAAIVAFLASPDSGFVTGTVIDVNGGSYFT